MSLFVVQSTRQTALPQPPSPKGQAEGRDAAQTGLKRGGWQESTYHTCIRRKVEGRREASVSQRSAAVYRP